jgi:hypothetical protein
MAPEGAVQEQYRRSLTGMQVANSLVIERQRVSVNRLGGHTASYEASAQTGPKV